MITITIKTDNSAFEDNPDELVSVLAQIPNSLADDPPTFTKPLYDTNGNWVGSAVVS